MDLHALGRSAVALHQQGRLAEAESLYRQVIAADPRLFPPFYLLGVLRLQQGDPAEAAALLSGRWPSTRMITPPRPSSAWR